MQVGPGENERGQRSALSRAESHRSVVVLMTPEVVASMASPARVCLKQMGVILGSWVKGRYASPPGYHGYSVV